MVDIRKLIPPLGRRSIQPQPAEPDPRPADPEPMPQPKARTRPAPPAPSVTISLEEACERIITLPDGKRIALAVPRGISDGQRIAVQASRRYHVPVHIDHHMWFSRQGDDIHSTILVEQQKCLPGGSASVRTIDGSVSITLPSLTQPGHRIRLKGCGMPHQDCPDQRGDHIATIRQH